MPTTTDGKKFDYSKLGMMKAHMHQQRLDKKNKSMGAKVGTLGIITGGAGAYLGHQYEVRKYEKMKTQFAQNLGMVRRGNQWKFQSEIRGSVPKASSGVPMTVGGKKVNLRPQDPRVVKAKADYAKYEKKMAEVRRANNKIGRGGGGGGIYNVAQPVADKNLMNKYGKKLK